MSTANCPGRDKEGLRSTRGAHRQGGPDPRGANRHLGERGHRLRGGAEEGEGGARFGGEGFWVGVSLKCMSMGLSFGGTVCVNVGKKGMPFPETVTKTGAQMTTRLSRLHQIT